MHVASLGFLIFLIFFCSHYSTIQWPRIAAGLVSGRDAYYNFTHGVAAAAAYASVAPETADGTACVRRSPLRWGPSAGGVHSGSREAIKACRPPLPAADV